MAKRLSAGGGSEREVMLKKKRKDRKTVSEKKLRKNSSDDEKEMQQQIPTLEAKSANTNEKITSTTLVNDNKAAANVSTGLPRNLLVEREQSGRIKSMRKFIYHHGYLCNRTVTAWIITISYLLCIYIFLALLVTTGIYMLLYTTKDAPVYYGETTFIGGIPGIGFEPRKRSMKKEQNIFKWNIDDPTSYAFYVRRLRRILYEYAKMEIIPSKFKIDCKKTVVPYVGGKPVKHFCKIDATSTDENYGYGDCALNKKVFVLHFCLKTKFGYDIGTLCVMLRINKLFGYYPESPTYDLFANSSLDFEAYKICDQVTNVTACCNDDRMLFQCSVMEENTNVTIVQYPKFGYPYCFYPFNNQNGYMQPFVMIQLFNLIPNKRTGIQCVPTAPDLQTRSLILWFEITSKKKS
uniref:Sodium/potassium-transporting ATPase subunit beta n=1 Tax=Wuchereria bancrofti TaxID=6293 RepID=A0AAF5PZN3_WUCBA